ncbi:hypothetical protein L486_03889 [Kwoniella mangroviensis CBS 10435]|uniref:Uncharacterized protein n=1 Tax=Kwoniella mangroviensis CBS 10435 TaxID=1331196 RepID=A0A1B9IQQ2_9TREE|nr:hypothetical protein L486_03889 [Kwoniella mangroviensis CBS 10435]OCF75031.1 hypothetical protein I204_03879 [Kwoniella mangroviensis CBS 8886]
MQTLGTIEIIMKAGSYSPACYRSSTPSTMKEIGVVALFYIYRPRPALILLGLIHEQAKSPSPPRASLERKVSPIKDAVYLEDHQESPPSSQQAKRIRYLEDQLQQLSSQRSQSLETASRNNEIIDLTSVDDA